MYIDSGLCARLVHWAKILKAACWWLTVNLLTVFKCPFNISLLWKRLQVLSVSNDKALVGTFSKYCATSFYIDVTTNNMWIFSNVWLSWILTGTTNTAKRGPHLNTQTLSFGIIKLPQASRSQQSGTDRHWDSQFRAVSTWGKYFKMIH